MVRAAFKMKLKPGYAEEYKKRHDEIWPELSAELKEAGLCNYSIYLDEETNILFAFQEQESPEKSNDLPNKEIVKKWWKYMDDIMDTNEDFSPVTKDLKEVFYME